MTSSFEQIPCRVFLDSSTLQVLHLYGAFIYENEPVPPGAHILRMPNGLAHLEALRNIMHVNSRAQFQFALSETSLKEVERKDDPGYLRWAFDILEYWEQCLEDSDYDYGSPLMAGLLHRREFGYLSEGDRELLRDAIVLGCDAFLTMDDKLHRNASHLEAGLAIRIRTPSRFWELLRPWAAIFC